MNNVYEQTYPTRNIANNMRKSENAEFKIKL